MVYARKQVYDFATNTNRPAFHASKSVKAKTQKNAVGNVVRHIQGICLSSNVPTFFMFLLGSVASRRLFRDIGQGLLRSHKQNLGEWHGIGS